MSYDQHLADRIARILSEKGVAHEAKKMMGGLAFMVHGKMCVGIVKEHLMARIDPDIYGDCMQKDGCKPMDFTGRPMKGFVFVDPVVLDMDEDLESWIQLCLDFNPKAKSSKK